MATQKTTKKTKEKKEIKWIETLRTSVKNETTQFVVGLLCVMVSIYMILAFSSFVLNGGADQSALEQPTVIESLADPQPEQVSNATGRSGATIAQQLINGCFYACKFLSVAFVAQYRRMQVSIASVSECTNEQIVFVL